MAYQVASRLSTTPRSYIREILAATQDPNVISFAGGLPNPSYIDTEGIRRATEKTLLTDKERALSYATTPGDPELRQIISDRYRVNAHLTVDPETILITNGSQQCLDLIGKVLIDKGSDIIIEQPGYLGAIQAFSIFQPVFHGVALDHDGPDTDMLSDLIIRLHPTLMYGIPNSHNPSGVTYSSEKRQCIADLISQTNTVFVEDDAYGEVRFSSSRHSHIAGLIPDQTILLGSFSKIAAPGIRMGWIVAQKPLMDHLITVMQAAALHANYLSQRILVHYIRENDIDSHIRNICDGYRNRRDWMLQAIGDEMGDSVSFTKPEGGMFIWLNLPEGISAQDIAKRSLAENVAVVPGTPFYTDGGGDNALRLNFSNADSDEIREGIRRLAKVIRTG